MVLGVMAFDNNVCQPMGHRHTIIEDKLHKSHMVFFFGSGS